MALISYYRHNDATNEKLESSALSSTSRKPSPTRIVRRSRSIQIHAKSSCSTAIDTSSESLALAEHYDLATLAMYHRIIDYRERNPLTYIVDRHDRSAATKCHLPAETHHESETPSTIPSLATECDYIFEMDL